MVSINNNLDISVKKSPIAKVKEEKDKNDGAVVKDVAQKKKEAESKSKSVEKTNDEKTNDEKKKDEDKKKKDDDAEKSDSKLHSESGRSHSRGKDKKDILSFEKIRVRIYYFKNPQAIIQDFIRFQIIVKHNYYYFNVHFIVADHNSSVKV